MRARQPGSPSTTATSKDTGTRHTAHGKNAEVELHAALAVSFDRLSSSRACCLPCGDRPNRSGRRELILLTTFHQFPYGVSYSPGFLHRQVYRDHRSRLLMSPTAKGRPRGGLATGASTPQHHDKGPDFGGRRSPRQNCHVSHPARSPAPGPRHRRELPEPGLNCPSDEIGALASPSQAQARESGKSAAGHIPRRAVRAPGRRLRAARNRAG